MLNILRFILIVFLTSLSIELSAQTNIWRDIYTVKKKDTIYGIATSYGLTVEELMNANPEFKEPNFKLKKGVSVFIPYNTKKDTVNSENKNKVVVKNGKTIKIGVMLPLHDGDGDGKRMLEYYRGILFGCDSLREAGINTEIHAFNVTIDADIRLHLLDDKIKGLDIIYGPLYSKQVKPLADFCKENNIKLVIPFSISSTEVEANPNVFQIFQNEELLNSRSIASFLERFKDSNTIFVDCNDSSSDKGTFTFNLRKQLGTEGINYQITNLNAAINLFNKAFVKGKRNVIVLNTGRSAELNLAFRKLNELNAFVSGYDIAVYGYTEWMQYESTYRSLFHKYDVYIPSTFYYYKGLSRIINFEQNYKKWFGVSLQDRYIPRFAITGFDHAMFFVKGIHEKGQEFNGFVNESNYNPLQTPLRFKKLKENGGMQNNIFQLVHYRKDGIIETIKY